MTDLIIGDDTFRVHVTGEITRPALMLSNSLGTDLSMWTAQMPALTEHFRVIRYDTRGHGGSSCSDAPVSIAQLGKDALAILDALDIGKTHWLGLSMGGAIGLWLLVNAPSRIERAVLANTAPKLGTAETWNARIASVLAGRMEDNAKATIDRWFSPSYSERRPDRVEAIHAMLRTTSPQGYAACCAALRDMDLRAALGTIAHEVLVISGRDDVVIPADDQTAFISAITGAKHLALAARHMSNIEAEDAFNAGAIAFLTASSPRGNERQRKSPTAKSTASERGGASRRSNAARRPLKKAAIERAPTEKPRPAASAARKPAKTVTGRRPQAQKIATRRGARKAVKQSVKKAKLPKSPSSRRPTPVSAARAPIKKAKARAASPKAATKKTAKKPATASRRRPAKTARRPRGRRKT